MKKNIIIWVSVIIGVILTALVFISNIAGTVGSIVNSGVCYYGCPNSKRVDKLILEKKESGRSK